MPPRGRKITKRNTALTAVTTAATTAATTIQNHHIMPPRGRKTTKRNTALTAVTTAATTAASTATAAAAATGAATATAAGAAAINPSTRLGIPPIVGIPIPNLQICLAIPTQAARMEHDLLQTVGSCGFHVGITRRCSNPHLPLRMCGHDFCRHKAHHLCQIDWEVMKCYEEAWSVVGWLSVGRRSVGCRSVVHRTSSDAGVGPSSVGCRSVVGWLVVGRSYIVRHRMREGLTILHLRKEDTRMGEGWIIFLYNNQPKFAYTCGEDIDVGFAGAQ